MAIITDTPLIGTLQLDRTYRGFFGNTGVNGDIINGIHDYSVLEKTIDLTTLQMDRTYRSFFGNIGTNGNVINDITDYESINYQTVIDGLVDFKVLYPWLGFSSSSAS